MVILVPHRLLGTDSRKEEPPEPIEKHGRGGVIGGYETLQSQVSNRDNGWEHTGTSIYGLL